MRAQEHDGRHGVLCERSIRAGCGGDALRRSTLEIELALLSAIHAEQQNLGSQLRRSRLQSRVYLSWKVFNGYIERLRQAGLVCQDGIRLTEKGVQFLATDRVALLRILEDYGLVPTMS